MLEQYSLQEREQVAATNVMNQGQIQYTKAVVT